MLDAKSTAARPARPKNAVRPVVTPVHPVERLENRLLFAVPAGEDPSLAAWFRADSITAANGATVATWTDSSGNGFNATQSTAARRPQYIAQGIGTRPAVRFTAGSLTQLAFTRPVSGDFTFTVVFRSTQGIGNTRDWFTAAGLVDGEVGGVTNDFGLSLNATGQLLGGVGNADTTAASGVGFNDGRPHVATFTRNATTGAAAIYVDGKLFQQTTGGTGNRTAAARLTIGSLQTNANYLTGDVADVRVYSTALPAATRSTLESELMATYGIAPPAARTFTNPVANYNFPDPGVMKVGGTYYAFATNTGGRNAPVIQSSNLVNWSQPTDALPTLPTWARSGRTWAPQAALMADGVHYNLYYTAWSTADGRQHVGVAQATRPAGPYTPIGTAPFVVDGNVGGSIDSSVFTESNGTRYLLWKNDGNAVGQPTYLYIRQLSADGLSFVGPTTPLIRNDQTWEGSVVEAPELVKRNGKYYLFYSANSYTNASYGIGYAVANSLLGPYTKPAGLPWARTLPNVVGPGGQTFTTGPDGNTWMLYHSWENNLAFRATSVDMVLWNGDVPILRGPSRVQQPVPTFLRPAPTLTAARTDPSGTRASGVLASIPNTTFTLQFFAAPSAASTAPPVFVGATTVTANSSGAARFVDVPIASAAPGQVITVAATDPAGEASPRSAALAVRRTGDVDNDGAVSFTDLVALAQHYNTPGAVGDGDINGDGQVDFGDLVLLAQHYDNPAAAPLASPMPVFATGPQIEDERTAGALLGSQPPARRIARQPRPLYA